MDFSLLELAVLALAAFSVGVAKGGIPGFAIIGVVSVPMIMSAKLSTGYILPFLLFADVLAVLYWRKAALWHHIAALLPAMVVGIAVGWLCMDRIDDALYGKLLGGIVLFLIALDWLRRRYALPIPVNSRPFAWSMGFLAGIMTMLANSAGPVLMLYLLSMNLSKEELVSTNAWMYLLVNLIKVPFSIQLGLISPDSFQTNLMMAPAVVLGIVTGIVFMRRIPEQVFSTLMRLLALAGAVKMLF